jgi:23S rRNA pseudouridine2605 synthase
VRPPARDPNKVLSLARALSKFGVCSRTQAARLIEAGRVRVGGRVVTVPSHRIDPRQDAIVVDGKRVGDVEAPLVVALHKPVGFITSRVDPGGRPTVYGLLDEVGRWVFPVGRLDRDTSGLLILTNDHRLGERLTSPDHHVPKTYHVRLAGVPEAEALRALRSGVKLDRGEETRPARVRSLGARPDGTAWLEVVLFEGKNRQVRRMCAAVGHDVVELVRVKIGSFALGDLPSGKWRRLTPAEVERLQSC